MTEQKRLRCGVVGVGRMGRHHARVYAQRADVEFVGVVDVNAKNRNAVTEQWGGAGFERVEDLVRAGVDAVTIATPTTAHRAATDVLLEAKVACLVEKPLAPDAAEAAAIAGAAQKSGVVLQVGHIVRFDPVMLAIRGLDWLHPRYVEVDRISPMTFRSIDVGVVLDMMIHDLDVLLMLMGREPDEIHASAVNVLGSAEDACNARLHFAAREGRPACVANITASRLALKTERKIRLMSEEGYVSADFMAKKGTVVRKQANEAQLAGLRARLADGEDLSNVDYLSLVKMEPLSVGGGEPLSLQIEDFLATVRSGRRPAVDAQAGFAAVRTAERIVAAARMS